MMMVMLIASASNFLGVNGHPLIRRHREIGGQTPDAESLSRDAKLLMRREGQEKDDEAQINADEAEIKQDNNNIMEDTQPESFLDRAHKDKASDHMGDLHASSLVEVDATMAALSTHSITKS